MTSVVGRMSSASCLFSLCSAPDFQAFRTYSCFFCGCIRADTQHGNNLAENMVFRFTTSLLGPLQFTKINFQVPCHQEAIGSELCLEKLNVDYQLNLSSR